MLLADYSDGVSTASNALAMKMVTAVVAATPTSPTKRLAAMVIANLAFGVRSFLGALTGLTAVIVVVIVVPFKRYYGHYTPCFSRELVRVAEL